MNKFRKHIWLAVSILTISTMLLVSCESVWPENPDSTTVQSSTTITTSATNQQITMPTTSESTTLVTTSTGTVVPSTTGTETNQSQAQVTTEPTQPTSTTGSTTQAPTTTSPATAETTGKDSLGNTVLKRYNAKLPDTIVESLKYTRYSIPKDYVMITVSSAAIRKTPDSAAQSLGSASRYTKVPVVALVKGKYFATYKTDLWYEVNLVKSGQVIHGYILAAFAKLRTFQFQKMADALNRSKTEIDNNRTAYIANYKNANGLPPTHNGATTDAYDERRYQSAPAYLQASTSSDFRYLSDGTLVSILEETPTFFKVRALSFAGDYYIPKKYVSLRNSIDQLRKVILVDRKNQNEAVFEYRDNKWTMVSFTFATTGENARYKLPTPLGYFMAIQRSDKFIYLDDVTKEIDGYAPYVIRFSGGAYVHGVPVNFKDGQVVDGRIIAYPPKVEYLSSIGTIPRSHKCVRNYTSHAKFLYDWIEIGASIVIVIE